MTPGRRTAALAFALLATTTFAQYRWVDESGQVNYGDSPPANAQGVRRIDARSADSGDSNTALPFEVRRAASRFPVTLYLSDECRPCDSGRALLSKRGVPFSERWVDSPEASAELKKLAGTDKVPVIAIGRDVQSGFDALKWERALDAAGYPAQSQLGASYSNSPGQSLVARSQAAPADGKTASAP